MEKVPVRVHFSDAPAVEYTKADGPIDAVSRRLIRQEHGANLGVHHGTIQPPADYSGSFREDVAMYALDGTGTVWVDGQELSFGEGDAILIPGGSQYRHTVEDAEQTILIVFSPPPSPGKHH